MPYQQIEIPTKTFKRKTAIGLLSLLLFFVACYGGWYYLQKQPKVGNALAPIRSGLTLNETFFRNFFNSNRTSATYSKASAVAKVRVNGNYGLKDPVDTAQWRLHIAKKNSDTLKITLQQIMALPKTEVVFDFKCIEGWNQITHWAGVKFSDFAKHYSLTAETLQQYAGLETPDGKYYVGLDMESLMHSQTILCYEMNGKPLPLNQGYPLRLIIPVKYGVKHLKRIGVINFSNLKPKDFWYEQGYDYYCGL
jgi:DMSO/TMAO reductase YedYZ molybdopterin-dependent catalytic subunit